MSPQYGTSSEIETSAKFLRALFQMPSNTNTPVTQCHDWIKVIADSDNPGSVLHHQLHSSNRDTNRYSHKGSFAPVSHLPLFVNGAILLMVVRRPLWAEKEKG